MKTLYFIIILALLAITPTFGESRVHTLYSEPPDNEILVFPEKFLEGPDSLIYVADYKDYYIKVYSPEGKFLRKIGGKSEGPGKIMRFGTFGFSWDKKSIFFAEYFGGHKWITFIDLYGKYKSIIKLDIKPNYGVYEAAMLPDGRFILEINEHNPLSIKKNSDYFKYYLTRNLQLISKNGNLPPPSGVSTSNIRGGTDCTHPFFDKV